MVNYLIKLPLSELRRRQDIVEQQFADAFKLWARKTNDAFVRMEEYREALRQAVDKKEFGD
jgi:hypothetical protein